MVKGERKCPLSYRPVGSVFIIKVVNAIREDREPVASIHDCVGTMRLYEAVLDRRKDVTSLVD